MDGAATMPADQPSSSQSGNAPLLRLRLSMASGAGDSMAQLKLLAVRWHDCSIDEPEDMPIGAFLKDADTVAMSLPLPDLPMRPRMEQASSDTQPEAPVAGPLYLPEPPPKANEPEVNASRPGSMGGGCMGGSGTERGMGTSNDMRDTAAMPGPGPPRAHAPAYEPGAACMPPSMPAPVASAQAAAAKRAHSAYSGLPWTAHDPAAIPMASGQYSTPRMGVSHNMAITTGQYVAPRAATLTAAGPLDAAYRWATASSSVPNQPQPADAGVLALVPSGEEPEGDGATQDVKPLGKDQQQQQPMQLQLQQQQQQGEFMPMTMTRAAPSRVLVQELLARQSSGGGSVATEKRCTCKHSKCIKLYCVCWAAGVMCNGCMCQDCFNRPENEAFIKAEQSRIRSRNPEAFRGKVEQGRDGEVSHKIGCRCRRSQCIKKYCECFDGGVRCSVNCRCVDCYNRPDVLDGGGGDGLASLACAAQLASGWMDEACQLTPGTAAAVAPYRQLVQHYSSSSAELASAAAAAAAASAAAAPGAEAAGALPDAAGTMAPWPAHQSSSGWVKHASDSEDGADAQQPGLKKRRSSANSATSSQLPGGGARVFPGLTPPPTGGYPNGGGFYGSGVKMELTNSGSHEDNAWASRPAPGPAVSSGPSSQASDAPLDLTPVAHPAPPAPTGGAQHPSGLPRHNSGPGANRASWSAPGHAGSRGSSGGGAGPQHHQHAMAVPGGSILQHLQQQQMLAESALLQQQQQHASSALAISADPTCMPAAFNGAAALGRTSGPPAFLGLCPPGMQAPGGALPAWMLQMMQAVGGGGGPPAPAKPRAGASASAN